MKLRNGEIGRAAALYGPPVEHRTRLTRVPLLMASRPGSQLRSLQKGRTRTKKVHVERTATPPSVQRWRQPGSLRASPVGIGSDRQSRQRAGNSRGWPISKLRWQLLKVEHAPAKIEWHRCTSNRSAPCRNVPAASKCWRAGCSSLKVQTLERK